jgi:hypothetical protein
MERDKLRKIRDVVALALEVEADRITVDFVGHANEGWNKVYIDIKLDGVDLTEEQQDRMFARIGGKAVSFV